MLKKLLHLFVVLLFSSSFVLAQETNSSVTGFVKGAGADALTGATITAVHGPTGTTYRVVSRTGGRFDINNMTPGGPYTFTISYVGYSPETRNDVYLNLGEKHRFDFALANQSGNLTEVVVSSRRVNATARGGVETNISRDRIQNLPTINRSLNDYIRLTPQAKITGDGGVSIAGQNNRYNAFYIDGAINNDVFGLAASGTNGGQANINPISVDAIDQMQVIVSPFDASIGGFTGGGVNATTRSGTNTLTGSAWYYYRNENLAGKTPGDVPKAQRTKLADLSNQIYGFRVGGPIIKNKLFFFLLGEIQRDTRPQPFDFSGYRGNTSLAQVNALADTLRRRYSYDPGGFLDNPEQVKANRIIAKIDWNLNAKHKLTFSYRYNQGERYNTSSSSSTTINFYNNGYIFPNKTHTFTGELRSNFSSGTSNRLLVTYSDVEDNRDPIGTPFPRVTINDGAGSLVFGTENFSGANYLGQKNLSIFDAFRITAGKHLITVGTDNLYNESVNTFIRDFYGTYTYNNLADFYSGAQPRRYQRSFPLVSYKDEKNTDAAAAVKYLNLAFFVNDEVKVTDRLTINFGVRADKTEFLNTPRTDPFFNDTALRAISAYYDMHGARSGQKTEVPWSISPRLGFTYQMPDENITVRGGIGYFTGRMPLVWPGGVYNNNGIAVGGIDLNPPGATQQVPFRADPFAQYTAQDFGIAVSNAKGQVDLMSKEFQLPKIFRTSFGIDKRIGNGWTASVDLMYTKNIHEIYYQNVNIVPATLRSVGPGARPVYGYDAARNQARNNFIPMRANGTNPYTGVFLLYNNPNEKGYSYNVSATINKAFTRGLSVQASWTWGNSQVTNEGTSSQNNSQWRFMETVNGKNFVQRSRSDFDMGHRFQAYASKRFSYAGGKLATTITLNYNGQQGQPFSYVYRNSIVGDDGGGSSNDLIFVPTASQIQTMTFEPVTSNGVTYTQDQQRALLENYIGGNGYLSKRRGQFAERNGDRLPFQHIVDLGIKQDFNLKFGGRTYSLQLTYDVYNFGNMINRNWGRTYFLANDNYSLITFSRFNSQTDLTPRYQFTPQAGTPYGLSTSAAPGISARWISQVGVRVNF
ncbi:MAG: TonB-dependent receptor [Chitinophagaceae bacterium]|nr:MAG: TonB-dependent receptor [Chitinophagaceae bacterium]